MGIPVSCLNEVMNTRANENPQVGMGATIFVGSDRYAMVITKVNSPKSVMLARVYSGDEQKFVTDENGTMWLPEELLENYSTNENRYSWNRPTEYTLRKNGRWIPRGTGLWATGSARFGYAETYLDPSF